MLDCYSTLELPRRPWLEPDMVKDAFHRLSATLHPDVPGTGDAERFAALNAAFTTLRDPTSRLRHFIDLTVPGSVAGNAAPPSDLGDLFMELASLRRRLDAFLAQRRAASSPLSRALLSGDEKALQLDSQAMEQRLTTAEAEALDKVRQLDATWANSGSADVAVLAPLLPRLSYLSRWLEQTREARFTLAG